MKTEWKVSNIEKYKYLGIIEFQDNNDEWHNFEVLQTSDKLVFGGVCNTGFLESGYMLLDNCFSIDENLQELMSDLATYYNDGKEYTNQIIYNERM